MNAVEKRWGGKNEKDDETERWKRNVIVGWRGARWQRMCNVDGTKRSRGPGEEEEIAG